MDGNTEKYGLELDLLITKFKNKVNQVKNDIRALGQEAKANVGDIKVDINMKTLDKDIKKTKAQIQSLNEQMQEYQKYGYTSSPLYKSLAKDLEEATQRLRAYEQAQAEANEEMEESERISARSSIKIGKNFNSLTKKISRYALSLFSLGTIYSLVSRASSAYLSQDVELANKLQSAWVGLGAILAPVIEKMADLIIRLVSYVNVFVTALTGVNYIAQATAKYMNNVADSTKKANKQLASFDELNNLSDSSTSTATNNPFEVFEDVKLNPKIVESLQDLAYWLKENWNWIKVVGATLLTVFAVSKLAGAVRGIGTVTSALGAGGLWGALAPFLTLGAIAITFYIAGNIKKDLKEIEESTRKIMENSIGAKEAWLETNPPVEDVYNTMNVNNEAALSALDDMYNLSSGLLDLNDENLVIAEQTVVGAEKYLDYLKDQYEQGSLNEEQQKRLVENLLGQLDVNNLIIQRMERLGLDTSKVKEINKEYAQFTYDIYQNTLNQGYAQDEVLEKLGLTKTDIEDIYEYTKNNEAVIDFQADTNDLRKELGDALDDANKDYSNWLTKLGEGIGSFFTTLFGGIGSKLSSAVSSLSSLKRAPSLKNLASYDVGTNYVPSDMLAMVHKGETIIPKKFNNKEFLSSMGSDETNALLVQVIDRLDNINFQPYVTVKDVGSASVNYINEQNRYQGRSVIK